MGVGGGARECEGRKRGRACKCGSVAVAGRAMEGPKGGLTQTRTRILT